MTIYYSPEKYGLETIGALDTAGSWEFDIMAVFFEPSTGRVLTAKDSGCSCPSPFDMFGINDLEEVRSQEDLYKALWAHAQARYGDPDYFNDGALIDGIVERAGAKGLRKRAMIGV